MEHKNMTKSIHLNLGNISYISIILKVRILRPPKAVPEPLNHPKIFSFLGMKGIKTTDMYQFLGRGGKEVKD